MFSRLLEACSPQSREISNTYSNSTSIKPTNGRFRLHETIPVLSRCHTHYLLRLLALSYFGVPVCNDLCQSRFTRHLSDNGRPFQRTLRPDTCGKDIRHNSRSEH